MQERNELHPTKKMEMDGRLQHFLFNWVTFKFHSYFSGVYSIKCHQPQYNPETALSTVRTVLLL